MLFVLLFRRQQQQQSVSVEGLESASARALVGKLINLLLSVIAVLLVLVNALSGFLMPFIKSQVGCANV